MGWAVGIGNRVGGKDWGWGGWLGLGMGWAMGVGDGVGGVGG